MVRGARMLDKTIRAMLGSMAAAVAMLGTSAPALAQARRTGPSDYLKCDGQPNNMTAGESIGRLIGAVTLLGIFAPPA